MKQYRLRLFHPTKTLWTDYRNITVPFEDKDILTIQFTEPLTISEAKEFFKHYVIR